MWSVAIANKLNQLRKQKYFSDPHLNNVFALHALPGFLTNRRKRFREINFSFSRRNWSKERNFRVRVVGTTLGYHFFKTGIIIGISIGYVKHTQVLNAIGYVKHTPVRGLQHLPSVSASDADPDQRIRNWIIKVGSGSVWRDTKPEPRG